MGAAVGFGMEFEWFNMICCIKNKTLRRFLNKRCETCWDAIVFIPVRHDGNLGQQGGAGRGEKWFDSEYTLKVGQKYFLMDCTQDVREREET